MAQRIVKWTRTADVQFIGILEYWVNRNQSPEYSKKLINKVSKKTKLISEKPFINKKADYKDTYVSIFDNYSIFYKVTDVEILILAFWDNRQDPKRLLQILKNK